MRAWMIPSTIRHCSPCLDAAGMSSDIAPNLALWVDKAPESGEGRVPGGAETLTTAAEVS